MLRDALRPLNRSVRPSLLAAALCAVMPPVWADEAVEHFEKHIRPLLVEKCYECHSAEKKVKGGLRLDTKEGWMTGGDSGPAITPGQPDASLVMKAVSYKDRDLKMPPKQKLTESEMALLNDWIANGAVDPRVASTAKAHSTKNPLDEGRSWWSFQPIHKPAVPAVKDETWPRNAIDRFVLAKLEANGLRPSPDASAEVLARRLSYDLTGLPPAGKAGSGKQKAEIESMLASPAFAERWASHWLDIARFAESSGGGRTLPFKDAWRYRDYVIESIRDEVPLDRFLTEQIAGDLLPHATPAERRKNLTATGLLVLGPTNYEEQDKGLLRMDIVDEQLELIGKSFLGMTIGCARCHDHKFDPISARDYYAMAGILRSTKVIKDPKENVAHWIDHPLPMDEPHESAMQAKEAKLVALKAELEKAKLDAKKAGVDAALTNLKPGPLPVAELPGIVVDDSEAKLIGAWHHSTTYKSFIGDGYLTDKGAEKGTLTASFQPKRIEAGRYEVRLAYMAGTARDAKVPVLVFHADGEDNIKVDQSEPPPIDGRWVSLGTFRFETNGEGHVLVSNTDTSGFVTVDAVQFLRVEENVPAVAAKKPAKVKSTAADRVRELTEEIKALEKGGPKRDEAMTVAEQEVIEDSPIHIRGQIRNLGAVVPRGFLSAVPVSFTKPMPKDQSGRLELAQWLTAKDNPLTARVLANRIWLWLMGEGLVRTPDNFGTTGEKPTHPELLDYLASELMESGWSLKHLVRLIVESRTYQQSSAAIQQSLQADPDNKLFWRANRRRLDAESLRDTILTVSGTLDLKFGGPNVQADAVDSNSGAAQNLEYSYVFTDTRRSLYTPAFRNKRLELFEAFDFADINGPIGKRTTSTVAPQALYLLNHEFVITQSRKAAERLVGTTTDDAGLVAKAYRETLGRAPTEREARLALDFVAVSDAEPDKAAKRLENWALFLQALFASADFRYLN